MKHIPHPFRLTAGLVLCAALPASASTVLTFDGEALATYQNTRSSGGWTYSAATSGPDPVNLAIDNVGRIAGGADHSLGFGYPFVPGSPITSVSIRTTDGSAFQLESFVLSDGFGNANLRIQGFLDGSLTAYAPVDRNIFDAASTFNFTGWDMLDEIRITNSTGLADLNFDIDDISYSAAVPEPSSAALLGLAALAIRRRR
ncbi:MAG: PEP-CTERM sorting domain-containing protein [Verrucomicrobiota bacterium]